MCEMRRPTLKGRPEWFKSSLSGGSGTGACVEVAAMTGGVAMRNSKNRSGPILLIASACREALLDLLRDQINRL